MSVEGAIALLCEHLTQPMTLIDVGARGGAVEAWTRMDQYATVIGFEPDPDETQLLNEQSGSHRTFVAAALGDDEGSLTMHLTRDPACSSAFKPVRGLWETFPGCAIMTPGPTRAVPCRRLDCVMREMSISRVEGMKLDAQGFELNILRGAGSFLESCVFIDIEVEFNELYESQPLFCDVDRFLRNQGFVLWRISNMTHYSRGLRAYSAAGILLASDPGHGRLEDIDNGQLYWAQAQYVRAEHVPTRSHFVPLEHAVPAALLMGICAHWDFSIELIRRTGESTLSAELEREIPPSEPLQTIEDRIRATTAALQVRECEILAKLHAAESELAQLKASRSWRMTAPLRSVRSMFAARRTS